MHHFTFHDESGSTSWQVPDGLHALPAAVASGLDAKALVALGECAVILGRSGIEKLTPTPSRCKPGQRALCWRPPRPRRPRPMENELTLRPRRPRGTAPASTRLRWGDGHERVVAPDQIVLVGRHAVCTVVLEDPKVSALHCALVVTPSGVRVQDLRSSNGTFLGSGRIEQAVVDAPSTLRVGDTLLEIVTDEPNDDLIALPSPQMRAVERLVARLAPARAPVLILGESGVGKAGVARRLHAHSGRPGRLVVLNAAVVSPQLAASELFGHVRGAFTGAERHHEGAFVNAHRGTLFLDEVAELLPEVQAELLRVVEQGVVRPVGSTEERRVDVRLVTATHRDLVALVRSGLFREDLYHRICVVPIEVPPLRHRPDDVDALIDGFLARQPRPRRLSPTARARLREQPWPGNVRELLNVLQRAMLLHDGSTLRPRHLDLDHMQRQTSGIDDLIHAAILEVYRETGGSVARTSRQLGLRRDTVYRHVGLERARHNRSARPPSSAR